MRISYLYLQFLSLFAFCLMMPVTMAHAQAQESTKMANAPGSFADLVDDLLPAVVNISSTQKAIAHEDFPELPQFPEGSPFEDFFEEFMQRRGQRGMDQAPPASLGSGFVIDAEEGYIITNNHVIRDAEEVRVTFHDDVTLTAEIIGHDEKTDLAVLKVNPEEKELHDVEFGDSAGMRVGDWVVAIGNPFGLGGTVTAGIISARQRDIQAGPYDDFIQTDASINRGNSGGPMFNLNGEVIGVNTAIFSPSGGSVGIGFAIPSALARPVVDQLIEFGRTRRGWLGVRIQSVTEEIAESLGLEGEQGALVASITPEGPAERAGLQHGDVILEFNGRTIDEMRDLPRIVAETPIGEEVDVVLWREGERVNVSVEIAELEKAEEEGLLETGTPAPANQSTDITALGLSVSELNEKARMNYSIPREISGVIISDILDGSEAMEKGLQEGDVIVELNQQAVDSPEGLVEVVGNALEAGRKSVLLLVNRGGNVRFVAMKLQDSTTDDPADEE